jgi:hypothetical protein
MARDLAEHVDGRPGWSLTGPSATFRPAPGGWFATVRPATIPGRSYERWHVAIVSPTGVARSTTWATTVEEAVRIAERRVRARADDT